eukprot:CAMPEP_0176327810 /NCGR_PEP_ID=MMETSP0121_2-20121125/74641_1 /TAXON_ID=160619 /ORGANISM="Kryptoperidinium foliaceum, Strain CCMP 1326" /LENGTH=53 /DNA_ID=CAMNT_0017670465 /DNA_START=47 /DNA_END=204 /DNA_ORIENTATION=-
MAPPSPGVNGRAPHGVPGTAPAPAKAAAGVIGTAEPAPGVLGGANLLKAGVLG